MDHRTRGLSLPALLTLAGLLTLLVPALALAQTSQQVSLTLKEFMITPSKATVQQGQSVRFSVTNAGTEQHNFTVELEKQKIESKLFNTNLMPGETRMVEFTFPAAGEWEMYCPLEDHKARGMKGDLEVLSTSPGGMPSTGAASTLSLWLVGLFGLMLLTGGLLIQRRQRTR